MIAASLPRIRGASFAPNLQGSGLPKKSVRPAARHSRSLFRPESPGLRFAKKVCPSCGAEMILRTAKKVPNTGNQFWGCSNYPACKKNR